jgi:hypothetical protein
MRLLGFDLDLGLFEVIDLPTNKFHLVNLSGDYVVKRTVSRVLCHAAKRSQARK